ncbi:MAG TPA: sulfotransferase [Rhizomicrobium sp.]|nr:sulfotransferase [Rhizomicrobium sp.]
MTAGPDFICIGMQKAGTGWLYDQLQYHPDFWMPPTKEIHYLDRDPPRLKNVTDLLERARDKPHKLEKRFERRRRWDERDYTFLEEAASLSGQPLDYDRYAALFRFKGDLLSGDVTPGYSGLEQPVIEQIAQRFPDVRIVFLIREPVSRAWSQISMGHRNGTFDEKILETPERFAKYLKRTGKIHKVAFPSRIAAPWEWYAPNVKFQHFFFDDIAERPDETRRAILEFIGADPAKSSGELSADHNKKSSNAKLDMTDDIKAVMVEFFADEIRASARRFGGHAVGWAEKYAIAL